MKKIIALLMTLIMAVGILCGCSQKEGAPDGMKALESTDNLDYYIYIPAAWTQDLSTGVVSAYASSSDRSNISMTQGNLEELKPLSECVDKYCKDLENNLKDFKMSKGYPEKTILGGVAASKLEYTATLAGNQYKFMQVICIKETTIYYFTYTALAGIRNEDKAEETVIETLVETIEETLAETTPETTDETVAETVAETNPEETVAETEKETKSEETTAEENGEFEPVDNYDKHLEEVQMILDNFRFK